MDLLGLPYFDGISIDDLVSLVDLLTPAEFETAAVIAREGDPNPQPLIIVTHGRLLVTKRAPDGSERQLAELKAPTLLGEIELFCGIPAVCSARALSRVSACTLDRPTFDRLFAARHPGLVVFTFNVARVASHRLAVADAMLAQVLADKDLCQLRRRVFASLDGVGDGVDEDWSGTTGVFRRKD